jgi:hypothetical protein
LELLLDYGQTGGNCLEQVITLIEELRLTVLSRADQHFEAKNLGLFSKCSPDLAKEMPVEDGSKSEVFAVQLGRWRRERDSNPRYGFPYSGFQVHRMVLIGVENFVLYLISQRLTNHRS